MRTPTELLVNELERKIQKLIQRDTIQYLIEHNKKDDVYEIYFKDAMFDKACHDYLSIQNSEISIWIDYQEAYKTIDYKDIDLILDLIL